MVEGDDAAVGRRGAGRLRHAPGVADAPVVVRRRERVRLGLEVVDGRVLEVDDAVLRLVHVPHAHVFLEHVARIGRRLEKRAAVAHRERRAVVHLGETHPEHRHAVLVPRVDLVRDDVPFLVHEGDVRPVVVVEVVVGEAVVVLGANLHQHGEVRERLRARVARDGEREVALEVVHHPDGVRAVVEEVRVGRADRLPLVAKRGERA